MPFTEKSGNYSPFGFHPFACKNKRRRRNITIWDISLEANTKQLGAAAVLVPTPLTNPLLTPCLCQHPDCPGCLLMVQACYCPGVYVWFDPNLLLSGVNVCS